jgi:peptide/nickel transport system substrate-binding protein
MFKRKRFIALMLLLALALLVACAQETAPAEEEAEAEEAGAEEAEAETSVVIVINEDPPSFNGAVSQTGYDYLVQEMVLLGVAEIDPWGNVFPELAADLPTIENGGVVVDEDAWTMDVTWTLRDDVQWADGEPVTSEDVVFTWDAIADPDMGAWVPGLDYTDSVEAIDEYTFVVHYNTIYPGYLTQFGGEDVAIWPAHYCDASQGFAAWDCAYEPLSDGPYILEEWMEGDHLTFVRNPNYFEEGKPYIDRVIVQIVPEPTVRRTMILEGDADVDMWVTETIAAELMDNPDVNLSIAPTDRWAMRLFPNEAAYGTVDAAESPHPIFSDVQVRQALRMAIDVDTIAEEIFAGLSRPVWTEFYRPPYDQCDIPRPVYDPVAAADLLTEAGWTDEDGDGVRECHGCTTGAEEGYPMSFELAIYDYGEELDLAQQLVAEQLAEIGMETNLVMVEGAIMWADSESGGTEMNGNFDLDMWDDGYAGYDPSDHLWYYYYSEAALPDYGFNIVRWINEDADYYIDESYYLDEEYRQEVFCELATLLDEEVPQILLFTTSDIDSYSLRVTGVQATTNDIMTWNIADWQIVQE